MSEKAEALRLADALDTRVVPRWVHSTGQTPQQSGYAADAECVQAAAELRRQHALIKEWEAKAETWLLSPEAAQRLDGYRELSQRAWRAEIDLTATEAELREVSDRAFKAEAECDALRANYNDLILSVGKKFPGESRHDTAKRYIYRAEHSTNNESSAVLKEVKNV